MLDASPEWSEETIDPLVPVQNYCRAVVKCNKRITAEDWYQDVRHLEFTFSDGIWYEPRLIFRRS